MPDPILPNLPSIQEQLRNKYGRIGGQVQQLPAPVASTLVNLDTSRVAKGQAPLTGPETVAAVGAALRGEPITPVPQESASPFDILGNFARDVGTFGRAIPHLPGALVEEVTDLGRFTQEAEEHGLLGAPGIRLIPGAYIANNLFGKGDPQELIRHPFFTALDVLPATKALSRIPVGEATLGSTIRQSRAVAPIAQAASDVGTAVKSTKTGLAFSSAFGKDAKTAARLESEQTRLLREAAQRDTDLTGTIYEGFGGVDLKRKTNTLRDTYSHIDQARQSALTDIAEAGDQAAIRSLPADEQAYISQVRQLSDEAAAVQAAEGEILDFKGEWYDQKTGRALVRGQRNVEQATRMQSIRRALQDPNLAAADPASFIEQARQVSASDVLSKPDKIEALRGVSYVLDQAGFDGRAVRAQLRLTDPRNPASVTLDDVVSTMDDVVSRRAGTGLLQVSDIVTGLRPYARSVPAAGRAIEALRSGNYVRARQIVREMQKAKTLPDGMAQDLAVIPDAISAAGDRAKFLSRTDARFNDKAVARLTKKTAARESSTVPARFMPSVQAKVRGGLLARRSTDPDFAQMQALIERGQYSASPTLKADAEQLTREVASTWRDMKAEGLDPVFIHHVSPAAASSIDFPRINVTGRTPSAYKRRTMDAAPYAKNMSVALDHQALELLARKGSEAYAGNITEMFGRRRFSTDPAIPGLDDMYRDRAERLATTNPSRDVNGWVDELIGKEWTRFDPQSLTPWRAGRATSLTAADEIFVPRSVAKTVEAIHNPKSYALTGVLDPVMKLFRTSVLALSPRWHFNNIFGGGMMLVAEDPRILTRLGKAWELSRSGETTVRGQVVRKLDLERTGVVGHGMGGLPAEVMEWNKTGRLPPTSRVGQIVHQFNAGRTMRRLLDTGGKVIDKSYAMNAWVDDLYRSAAYLDRYDRAIKSGVKNVTGIGDEAGRTMTREAAHQAGLNITRKVFQNWDAMTPIERNVMRYIFPFYGWTAHIMKYVTRYPLDHPIRAAVMGSFARAELDDLRDQGLPDSFLNMFFLGETDEEGNQRAISTSAINPFANVGNSFTLAGLVGNMNPVIGSFLSALGVDPMSGEAELYPDMTYDPDTGRFSVKTPGFVGSLAGSILPQGQLLMSLVGANKQYRELLKTNPDSAVNMLRSQAGLPIVFRNVPVVATQMKGELTRGEAQKETFREGLKSGDYDSITSRYPHLSPLMAQVRKMDETGELDRFRVNGGDVQRPDTKAMLYEGIVRRNLPGGDVQRLAGAYELQDRVLDMPIPPVR